MIDIEILREYCLSLGEVVEKIPFGKFARRYDSTVVFYVADHMFCLFDIDAFTSVGVRSTPDAISELMARYPSSVSGPRNPALKNWISVAVNGEISDDEIYALVKTAFEIIRSSHRPKRC